MLILNKHNHVIKEIKHFDDRIEFTFNSQLQKSPDKDQDFLKTPYLKNLI